MIQFDIRAHKEAMASLKTMERTLERECDNQLAAIDRTIGVWEGTAAQRFRSEYSSMLRMGEYASLQMQINGMYRVMEEALWEMTSLKNKCENFYSTLTGEEWIRWSLGDYGSPSSLLMADRGVIVSLCQEFDNLCEANRNACDVLESVIDECGGLIDFGGELEELRSMREKMNRVQNLREAMESYSLQLVSLDKDLSIRYSQWIDEDILSKIAAPQRIASLLAGDETAIAEFEKLYASGRFTQETMEYLAREYVKISQNGATTWEEVAMYLAEEALRRARGFSAAETELIVWRNSQYSLGYIALHSSEETKYKKVEALLEQSYLTKTEREFLCTCLESYVTQGDHERLKEITDYLLEGSYENRSTVNGTQCYYTVKIDEAKLQELKSLAIEQGANNLFNYLYALENMQVESLQTRDKNQCGYYLLSEQGEDGNARLLLCLETDMSGGTCEVCVEKDGGNLKLILEQCKDLSALSDEQIVFLYENIGNYDAIERIWDDDKDKAYECKQMLTNAYTCIKRQETEQVIWDNNMAEYLPYLCGDVPYIDGAELDAWNAKRTEAYQKREEWIAQGIDVEAVEEYYNNQCGEDLLFKIRMEAEENPVKSSCKSVVLNMIAGVSGAVYQLTSYLSGSTIDYTSGMYMPLKMSQTVRETVSNDIYEALGGGVAGSVGCIVYQGIMGAGDYGLAAVTGLGALFMGMEGYTETGYDGAQRGLSADDIQAEAAAGAIAEVVIERILSGTGKGTTALSHAVEVAKAGVGAAATSSVIWELDRLIAEELSYDEQLLQSYIASGEGEEDARIRVIKERLKQAAKDFGAGVVTAGVVDVAKTVSAGNRNSHVVENPVSEETSGGGTQNGGKNTSEGSSKTFCNVSELSNEQIEALIKYTGDDYVNINNSLRGLDTLTPENQAAVEAMKSALDNSALPQDMTLYRGTSTEALGSLQNLPVDELVGKTFTEQGFMSTSTSNVVAENFSGNMKMTIEASKGAQALDISSISQYTTEAEVLFNAGQEMLITSAEVRDGILNITVIIE